jgi:hypothetical protein
VLHPTYAPPAVRGQSATGREGCPCIGEFHRRSQSSQLDETGRSHFWTATQPLQHPLPPLLAGLEALRVRIRRRCFAITESADRRGPKQKVPGEGWLLIENRLIVGAAKFRAAVISGKGDGLRVNYLYQTVREYPGAHPVCYNCTTQGPCLPEPRCG